MRRKCNKRKVERKRQSDGGMRRTRGEGQRNEEERSKQKGETKNEEIPNAMVISKCNGTINYRFSPLHVSIKSICDNA